MITIVWVTRPYLQTWWPDLMTPLLSGLMYGERDWNHSAHKHPQSTLSSARPVQFRETPVQWFNGVDPDNCGDRAIDGGGCSVCSAICLIWWVRWYSKVVQMPITVIYLAGASPVSQTHQLRTGDYVIVLSLSLSLLSSLLSLLSSS